MGRRQKVGVSASTLLAAVIFFPQDVVKRFLGLRKPHECQLQTQRFLSQLPGKKSGKMGEVVHRQSLRAGFSSSNGIYHPKYTAYT